MIDEEVWKPVKSYFNHYEVSNKGNIRSIKNKIRRNLVPSLDKNGYNTVTLSKKGSVKSFRLHRLIAESFIGKTRKSKLQINHKNAIKSDNRLENLEWVTSKENIQHSNERGLIPHGEKHYKSRISSLEAEEIRRSTLTFSALAKMYKVTSSCISGIKTNKRRTRG